jgi:hypothetical protein
MDGPHSLTASNVDSTVTETSPGVYLLGHSSNGWRYVGRSDDDVAGRLKQHAASGTYSYFWYEYATSPKAAFERECGIWHRHGGATGGLDNKNHPARPAGSAWKCPVCSIFG